MNSFRLPKRGETVLFYQEKRDDESYEAYRMKALRSGGYLRRAVGWKSYFRHMMTYTPTFVEGDPPPDPSFIAPHQG